MLGLEIGFDEGDVEGEALGPKLDFDDGVNGDDEGETLGLTLGFEEGEANGV